MSCTAAAAAPSSSSRNAGRDPACSVTPHPRALRATLPRTKAQPVDSKLEAAHGRPPRKHHTTPPPPQLPMSAPSLDRTHVTAAPHPTSRLALLPFAPPPAPPPLPHPEAPKPQLKHPLHLPFPWHHHHPLRANHRPEPPPHACPCSPKNCTTCASSRSRPRAWTGACRGRRRKQLGAAVLRLQCHCGAGCAGGGGRDDGGRAGVPPPPPHPLPSFILRLSLHNSPLRRIPRKEHRHTPCPTCRHTGRHPARRRAQRQPAERAHPAQHAPNLGVCCREAHADSRVRGVRAGGRMLGGGGRGRILVCGCVERAVVGVRAGFGACLGLLAAPFHLPFDAQRMRMR